MKNKEVTLVKCIVCGKLYEADKKHKCKRIEVDCRKCINFNGEECIPFGKDANSAVEKCANDSFRCYATIKELQECEDK